MTINFGIRITDNNELYYKSINELAIKYYNQITQTKITKIKKKTVKQKSKYNKYFEHCERYSNSEKKKIIEFFQEKYNLKLLPKSNKNYISTTTNKKYGGLNCSSLRKSKNPMCRDTNSCHWIESKCKKIDNSGSCNEFRKTKQPNCNGQQGCNWVVGQGCLKGENNLNNQQINPRNGGENCNIFRKTKEPICENQDGCHWIVGQGCKKEEVQYLDNYSGVKHNLRLIYLICINGENYILKISNNGTNYSNEKKIYNFFGRHQADNIVRDNIIRTYELNDPIVIVDENNTQFNCRDLGKNDSPLGNFIVNNDIIPNFIENLNSIEKKIEGGNVFILQEKKTNYITYSQFLSRNNSRPSRQIVIFSTIKILYHLLITYGFNHNDLHSDNLLVNNENNNICLFDFDLSSLSNENNTHMNLDIKIIRDIFSHQITNKPPNINERNVIEQHNDHGRLRREFNREFMNNNTRNKFGFFYDISKLLISYKSIPNNYDNLNIILRHYNDLDLDIRIRNIVINLSRFIVTNYKILRRGHRYNIPIILRESNKIVRII